MGAETVSRAELARHQRERVISRVLPVFAERGYLATTVDDLLEVGKIGVGNFYSLFDGKEDCFLACLDRVVEQVRSRIDAAAPDAAPWDERAYLGLAGGLAYLCEEPLAARIILVEAQCAGAKATARYDAILDDAVAWLVSGRPGHPAARDLPPSFERATVSGLAYYLQQCLLDGRLPNAQDLLSETAGLVLEPVVGSDRLARLGRSTKALSR